MDLSKWYRLKDPLQIKHTNKKFYKKYLHRLNYRVVGAYIARTYNDRELLIKSYNLQISKKISYGPMPESLEILLDFFDIFQNRSFDYKIRIEGSDFAIFSSDLDALYDLASTRLSKYKSKLTCLCITTDSNLETINSGRIIVKKPTEHIYRVNLRSGPYRNFNERRALAEFISNCRDEIKITNKLLTTIHSGDKYLQGGYFHVRDSRLIDMITLIMPRIVLSVNELVVKPNQ